MIELQITGRHYDLDSKIVAYVHKKFGKLDRYLPKALLGEQFGAVVLEFDESHTQDSQCICDVQIRVKGENLLAKEATLNMYAAIDICEQKLKRQIFELKSKHDPARNRRRFWGRFFPGDSVAESAADPEVEEDTNNPS